MYVNATKKSMRDVLKQILSRMQNNVPSCNTQLKLYAHYHAAGAYTQGHEEQVMIFQPGLNSKNQSG